MAKEGLLVWASYSKNNARNDIYLPSPLGLKKEREREEEEEREILDWFCLAWKVCSYEILKETMKSQAIQKYSWPDKSAITLNSSTLSHN